MGWLKTLSEVSTEKGLSDPSQMCIVSCSMLKRSYRKYISKVASTVHEGNEFRFVFLYTTIEELVKRVGNRKGHFMKSDMVTSQYKIMEIPLEDELVANGGNSLAIDTTGKDIDEVFEGVRKEFIREGIDH